MMPVPKNVSVALPQRVLLRDRVRDEIRAGIMNGTFQPGEILNDQQLQDWLGVSRTPVRDALNELERIGLVEMSANRYTRVVSPSEAEVTDSLQTLGVLLGGVVRLAVPRLTEEQRLHLADEIARTITTIDDDLLVMNRAILHTFALFVDLCGNRRLIQVCNDTLDALAYRLRVGQLNQILDFDFIKQCFERLRAATLSGDGVEAELATEALHNLPGERPRA